MLPLNCTFHTRVQDSRADPISSTNRNWRFHTDLKMWLTKDVSLPEPVQMSLEKEQGSYVFFNQMAWEKVRVRNGTASHSCSISANDGKRYQTLSYNISNWHLPCRVRMVLDRFSEGVGWMDGQIKPSSNSAASEAARAGIRARCSYSLFTLG